MGTRTDLGLTPAQWILDASDEFIWGEIEKLLIGLRLKTTFRYNAHREGHCESVADHVFALIYLDHYFRPLEDTMRILSDRDVFGQITFHDFGEILGGDVPYHLKTEEDIAREAADAERVFSELPEALGEVGKGHLQEHELRRTRDACYVHGLDKIEPGFHLLDPVNVEALKRTKCTADDHHLKKVRATEHLPVMRRFVDVTYTELLRRDAFFTE